MTVVPNVGRVYGRALQVPPAVRKHPGGVAHNGEGTSAMNTIDPNGRTVRLTREQRDVLRGYAATATSPYSDLSSALSDCDRPAALRHLRVILGALALLDAIGWTETPEAPDEQDVTVDEQLRAFAVAEADQLRMDLVDEEDPAWLDVFLGDFAALKALTSGGQ